LEEQCGLANIAGNGQSTGPERLPMAQPVNGFQCIKCASARQVARRPSIHNGGNADHS